MHMMRLTTTVFSLALMSAVLPAWGQNAAPASQSAPTSRPARPTPPARDPHTPGFVDAKELPDGEIPPADTDGNFIIGPTHKKAPELTVQDGVP